MKHVRLLSVCVGLVFLGSSLAPAQSGGLSYSVTDLGTYLTGSSITWSIAYAINEGDQVVGSYMDGKDQYCFLYTPGTGAISFSSSSTPKWCDGRAISILGAVAGTMQVSYDSKNAFLREPNGALHTYPSPLEESSFGYGVSYYGDVVGGVSADAFDVFYHPTRWTVTGQATVYDWLWGTITGTSQSAAYFTVSDPDWGYLIVNGNTVEQLPSRCPNSYSVNAPQAVNDNGDSVGSGWCEDDRQHHAVMWANGISYDWGTPPSRAYAISNQYWSEAWLVGWTGFWGGAALSSPTLVAQPLST